MVLTGQIDNTLITNSEISLAIKTTNMANAKTER